MSKNVIFLDENEIDKRIQTAVKNVKVGNGAKIYGVSGIGQENPVLTRTYDAAGITLDIADDGDIIECVASDSAFQEFFNFPEHTDELGNVFLTITPKAFKFDRTSNGEVTAISVKEYEDGDEEKGYMLHSFFKNWITETEYDGIVSRDIAKYLGHYNEETNQIEAKPNRDYSSSYKPWDEGREIIKNTNPKYGIMSWMFVDLFRMLFLIYFARTDIHKLFGLTWDYTNEDGMEEKYDYGTLTGTTDEIISHTGFNKDSNHYKIFNIDHALCGITVDGCYREKEGFYFSHLFEFDASKDNGALKSSIMEGCTSYDGEYDIITKIKYDTFDPAFKVGVSARQVTSEFPEGSIQNIYYSANQKIISADYMEEGDRGQLWVFGWNFKQYPDKGAFYSYWNYEFDDAWGYGDGVRLCKSPS